MDVRSARRRIIRRSRRPKLPQGRQPILELPHQSVTLSAAAFLAIHFLLWQVISVYVHYNNWLLWLAWRHRNQTVRRPPPPEQWPPVTVQLPIYNEPEVVERLLRAVGRLDYPRDRLQIQLLDDSTDGVTPELGARVSHELRATGLEVQEVRRTVRAGYKAGALQDALPDARGEFILLLDADFVPHPDLLKQLIPWFTDPEVGMVQARWGTVRPPESLVERCSVHWADRHFGIEQFARSRTGQFFHFNGSAGIWRRSAIEESGGWSAITLAEDLELSFRAWRRGWRFRFDPAVVVPSDPPPDMAALRIQQGRWARGAFQVARRILPQLGVLPLRERFRFAMHTTGYAFSALLLLIGLTSGPAAWARQDLGFWWAFLLVDFPAYSFLAGMLVQVLYRWWAGGRRAGVLELEAATLGLGLGYLILRRILLGWFTPGGEFVRTPKVRGRMTGAPSEVWPELGLGVLLAWSGLAALHFGAYPSAVLPLLAALGLVICAVQTVQATGVPRAA